MRTITEATLNLLLLLPPPPPPPAAAAGPDSPGEPDQVPHPALAAAAGQALPGEAWLAGVELALP